jgi:hypothetical protein
VEVPEEGGRDLVSLDSLAPGSAYTASMDDQDKEGLYRLEVGCSSTFTSCERCFFARTKSSSPQQAPDSPCISRSPR